MGDKGEGGSKISKIGLHHLWMAPYSTVSSTNLKTDTIFPEF